MPEAVRAAFIAALEREVEPLVSRWERFQLSREGTSFPAFRSRGMYDSGEAVLCCAGTGVARAEDATRTLLEGFVPRIVISVGFVGAASPELHVGNMVVPARVSFPSTGERVSTDFGEGEIVTLDEVAGRARKLRFWESDRILAVEMEAVGVARASNEAGVRFAAIKTVSDELDDDTEFVSPFVRPEGFDTAGFLKYIGVRPKLWPAVARLKRSSEMASAALCKAIEDFLKAPGEFSIRASGSRVHESSNASFVTEN
jgi:nucleoside phosphorylase